MESKMLNKIGKLNMSYGYAIFGINIISRKL